MTAAFAAVPAAVFAWSFYFCGFSVPGFAAAAAVFKSAGTKAATAKEASAEFWAAVAASGAGTAPFTGFAK